MNRQLAVSCEQRRREILDAHTRPAGHQDYVCVRVQRAQDRVGLIGYEAGKVDDSAIARDERREHGAVRIRDVAAVRSRPGRQQLVAGDDEVDVRLAEDVDLSYADRAEYAEILRTQDASGREQRGAVHDVLAAHADMLTRRDRGECADQSSARGPGRCAVPVRVIDPLRG